LTASIPFFTVGFSAIFEAAVCAVVFTVVAA